MFAQRSVPDVPGPNRAGSGMLGPVDGQDQLGGVRCAIALQARPDLATTRGPGSIAALSDQTGSAARGVDVAEAAVPVHEMGRARCDCCGSTSFEGCGS
jgi:hypothetical protein